MVWCEMFPTIYISLESKGFENSYLAHIGEELLTGPPRKTGSFSEGFYTTF